MIVLGIDPGRNQGWALLEFGAEIEYLDSGTRVAPQNVVGDDLLLWSSQFGNCVGCCDAVVVESGFSGPNRKTALQLAEIRGAIKLAAQQRKLDLCSVAPGEIKHCVAGRGNAKKHEVAAALHTVGIKNLPSKQFGEDESDAIAVAYTYCRYCQDAITEGKA